MAIVDIVLEVHMPARSPHSEAAVAVWPVFDKIESFYLFTTTMSCPDHSNKKILQHY